MRKEITALLSILIAIPLVSGYAETEVNAESADLSYYQETNAPVIYGATKITMPVITEDFNYKDPRFRVFATDIEDGDLTASIQVTGLDSVDTHTAGEYTVTYTVKDSHSNITQIDVPVIVEDNRTEYTIERTCYTLPSVWNMNLAGTTRCNSGDRQHMGIYMPANSIVKLKVSDENLNEGNFSITTMTNDANLDVNTTLNQNGTELVLTSSVDCVPFIYTRFLPNANGQANTPTALEDLNTIYKIEVTYDLTDVEPLSYYRLGDDEAEFRDNWKASQQTYSVIESQQMLMCVPLADEPKMTNYYAKGFKTLDEHLTYYGKVIDRFDEILGLEYDPVNPVHQNVRYKQTVRANVHGAGAAYYNGNHIGINSSSMAAFFEMNWGGLHEIAHGYQGSLGKGVMGLGEVSNNILGYYVQTDKSLYIHAGNWLGDLKTIENARNANRDAGWSAQDVSVRLYMIINLFEGIDRENTYTNLCRWYREQLLAGRSMTNTDAYVEGIYESYGVNVIPYMESWGLEVSENLKEKILEEYTPIMTAPADVLTNSLSTFMQTSTQPASYSLQNTEVFSNNTSRGSLKLTINLSADELNKIKDKVVRIMDGNKVIHEEKITDTVLTISDLPVGNYTLQLPVIAGYGQSIDYITIKEDTLTDYHYKYKQREEYKFNNGQNIQMYGIYNTVGMKISFDENLKSLTFTPGGANMGSAATINLYDTDGVLITSLSTNNNHFSHLSTSLSEVKEGYLLEIIYGAPGRVKVFSNLTDEQLTEYHVQTTTQYVITEYGFEPKDIYDTDPTSFVKPIFDRLLLENIAPNIEAILENKDDSWYNDRNISQATKADILSYYNLFKDVPSDSLTKILKGGSPDITYTGTLEYLESEWLEYVEGKKYLLELSGYDAEDGVANIKDEYVELSYLGNNIFKLIVSDTDGNVWESPEIKVIPNEVSSDDSEDITTDIYEIVDIENTNTNYVEKETPETKVDTISEDGNKNTEKVTFELFEDPEYAEEKSTGLYSSTSFSLITALGCLFTLGVLRVLPSKKR